VVLATGLQSKLVVQQLAVKFKVIDLYLLHVIRKSYFYGYQIKLIKCINPTL